MSKWISDKNFGNPSWWIRFADALPLDVRPALPSAYDDEFDTGSVLDSGKWTEASSACSMISSIENGWATLEPAATGTASTGLRGVFGYRQTVPGTGDFTISAKLINFITTSDDARSGLFVGIDSGAGHTHGHHSGASRLANAIGFTFYLTAQASAYSWEATAGSASSGSLGWYKIEWNNASGILTFKYSVSGYSWTTLTTRGSMSRPTYMGLGMYGNTANIAADHQIYCDWFRVTYA